MKVASLSAAALVLLLALAFVTGDGSAAPISLPMPGDHEPLSHERCAILPVTGREVIEAMLAESPTSDALPPQPDLRGVRTPERQARGLSGSA